MQRCLSTRQFFCCDYHQSWDCVSFVLCFEKEEEGNLKLFPSLQLLRLFNSNRPIDLWRVLTNGFPYGSEPLLNAGNDVHACPLRGADCTCIIQFLCILVLNFDMGWALKRLVTVIWWALTRNTSVLCACSLFKYEVIWSQWVPSITSQSTIHILLK